MCISANWWEEYSGKNGNTKLAGTELQNASKDTRKFKISNARYDMGGGWKGVLYNGK